MAAVFLLVYLVLVLTFGFYPAHLGYRHRTPHQAECHPRLRDHAPQWKFLGILTFLVPVLILPYYAVIGGWITKYAVVYLTGQSAAAAEDGYFYQLHYLAGVSCGVRSVVHGRDGFHRVQRRGGRH